MEILDLFICFVHISKEKKYFKDYNYTEEMASNRRKEEGNPGVIMKPRE